MSVCLSVCLSVCMAVCLSVSVRFWWLSNVFSLFVCYLPSRSVRDVVCLHVCLCVCVCVCECVCVCVCVCVLLGKGCLTNTISVYNLLFNFTCSCLPCEFVVHPPAMSFALLLQFSIYVVVISLHFHCPTQPPHDFRTTARTTSARHPQDLHAASARPPHEAPTRHPHNLRTTSAQPPRDFRTPRTTFARPPHAPSKAHHCRSMNRFGPRRF